MSPLRFVQFTDLHLYGAEEGRLRGVAVLPALRATLAAATARFAPWDGVLLTGDLVQDDPGGYAHVRELFGRSDAPVYCLPGNHDDPGALRRALAAPPFRLAAGVHGGWHVVPLDSCVPGRAGGRLAREELARLDAALRAEPERHALVCLHHHPVPLASRWLDSVALEDPAALFAVLDAHPQVRAVVWGHVHQAWEGERNGVRLFATPSTCAQFKPLAPGFALDVRPPAYRRFELHADGRIDTAVEWVESASEASRSTPMRAARG